MALGIERMRAALFGRRTAAAEAPAGERLYAIGDVHGRDDLLADLLVLIDEEPFAGRKRVVFLGDYVDRGPASDRVLDRLVARAADDPDAVFLKGNHEAAMLDFLADGEGGADWLDWGGEETLRSYGVAAASSRPPAELSADLRARLPDAHLAFLRGLSLFHECGDYLFVHAGLRPGTPLADQREDDLLWIREAFVETPPEARPDRVVVHGHQPARKPVDAGWRICVDTGAWTWGVLTAVVLEGRARRFLAARDR